MPKPRFSGGSVSMRSSSSLILPPESGRSPAIQLNAVDLPQPDGPSNATNSPRRIVIVSSLSAAKACPPAPAKRRVTRSSRSSLKSCFIASRLQAQSPRMSYSEAAGHRVNRRHHRRFNAAKLSRRVLRDGITSFGFLRPDLLIPDPERFYLRLRRQRLRVRELGEPAFVFRTAVLLDRVLAL